MRRSAILALAVSAGVAGLLTGCGRAPAPARQAKSVASSPRQTPVAGAAPSAGPSIPSHAAAPTVSRDSLAAAAVVRSYYEAIERRDYRAAWRLREPAAGLTFERFKASFAGYADYHATVGTASLPQGAAGSLYAEVPVQIYGRSSNGKPFGSAGTITLRRSNEVPGATAEQRSWRIYTGT